MISKNVTPTWTKNGMRSYCLYRECHVTHPESGHLVSGVHFMIVDEFGDCNHEDTHILASDLPKKYAYWFDGFGEPKRPMIYIDDPHWQRVPEPVHSEAILEKINGSPDRAYALEIIHAWLGLSFVEMFEAAKAINAKIAETEAPSP